MPTTLQTKFLEDSQGNKYAPVTTPNAVRWANGDNLDDKLGEKQDVINDLSDIRSGALAGTSAYQKPLTGIPASDLSSSVQTSLGKADTALQSHQSKADIGLSNVTNDAQVKRSEMGTASGVATLDSSGKVPSSQLPSYVDDVLEYADLLSFPATGESGKIYVDTSTNKEYRWSGSTYIEISSSDVTGIKVGSSGSTITPSGGVITIPSYTEGAQPHIAPTATEVKSALGTGSGTIKYLREDGTWQTTPNTTYQFEQDGNTLKVGVDGGTKTSVFTPTFSAPVTSVAGKTGVVTLEKSDVGLGNVGNFKAVSTETSQGLTDTEKSNARANIGAGTSSFSGSYDDLTNKPTIPDAQIQADWNQTTNTAKDYIKNKPTIPAAQVNADWNASSGVAQILNKPSSLPASDVSAWAKAATKPTYSLSEVGATASVVAITTNTSSSCSITGGINDGKTQTIIYTNSTASDLTVTVPTTYETPNGQAIELTCVAGGYSEVNYININGTIYARGL